MVIRPLGEDMPANITEIFRSIQGEGPLCGLPFVFIRFGGCHLRCSYCDTPEALIPSSVAKIHFPNTTSLSLPNPVEKDALLSQLKRFNTHYLCFTGGEPLLQAAFIESLLPDLTGQTLYMETSGTLAEHISETLLQGIDIWSVDIKLPSVSGLKLWEKHANVLKQMQKAKKVIVKTVFSDDSPKDELRRALTMTEESLISHSDTTFVFQPMTRNGKPAGSQKFEFIMNLMEQSSIDIRLIPQIHPILSLK